MGNAQRDDNYVPVLIGISSSDGKTPIELEVDPDSGRLLVDASVSVSSSGSAIEDGSDSSIKATVKDLADSNPLAVAIVDTNGDQIASFGSGTQYTDGGSTPTHPIGAIPVFDKAGTITSVSDSDPLPVSASIDTTGLATDTGQATGNTTLASIDTKMDSLTTPSDTQLVSAVSLPLPAGASTSTKQDAANTSLSSIDGKITAVNTGAVVISSSVLPSGAATAAKQAALGTAGTPSSDVLTVQGKSGMTALSVDGSGMTQPVSGTFWQTTQPVSGTVTANAGTNMSTAALALESGGNLAAIKTDVDKIPSQGQALAAASMPVVLTAAQVTSLTPPTNVGLNAGSNAIGSITNTSFVATQVTAANLNATVVGTGTFAVQAAATLNAETTKVIGTVNIASAQTLATVNAVTAITNALPSGTNLIGKIGIDQTTPGTTNAVVDTAVTSGGLSIATGSVAGTTTAIKTSAGQLYGYHFLNTTAAVAYVQIFNAITSNVTLGTTPPALSIGIPASSGATVNFDKGITFGTAISFACTTTRSGATGATCDVNFFYK